MISIDGKGINFISAIELKKHLFSESFTLIDLQPDVHDYVKEHIPGSVYINENHFRFFKNNLPAEYVQSASLENLFQNAGVSHGKPVVVYSGNGRFSGWGDGLEQTMAAYTLYRFGHTSIYILDGGFESWLNEGFEIDQKFPTVTTTDFTTTVRSDCYITYLQFCELKRAPDSTVIDVRPRSVYEGKSIWSKPGHIPGAINLPWRLLMDHENSRKIRPPDILNELTSNRKISPDNNIILYCGTGREATAAFIVFKFILNYKSVTIYEGSFTEWCTKSDQITETGTKP